jgi:hypothetical protein
MWLAHYHTISSISVYFLLFYLKYSPWIYVHRYSQPKTPARIGQKAGLSPEPVYMLWRKNVSLDVTGNPVLIPQPSYRLPSPYTDRTILLSIVHHLTGILQLRHCNLGYEEELLEDLRVFSGVKLKQRNTY